VTNVNRIGCTGTEKRTLISREILSLEVTFSAVIDSRHLM